MTVSFRRRVLGGCLVGWLTACSSSRPDDSAGVVHKALTSPDGVVSAVLSYTSDWGTGYCASVRVSNTGAAATTSWSVAINLNQSTVTSSWSAQFATSNGQLNVTPLAWNATIAAGGFTEFGFCANSPGSSNRPSIVTVTQTGASGGSTSSGGAPSAGGSPSGGTTPASGGTSLASGGTTPASGGTRLASGGTSNASGGTGPSTPGVATLTYQSDWGSGFCANVTVTNSGSVSATGWNVVINLNQATVTSSWSATFASSSGMLTVTPNSWNGAIPANGSVTFGICANASGTLRPVIASATVTTGGGGTGGTGAGGSPATGGSAPATGGKATGGTTTATGGTATGGKATGGSATGGTATGGKATGGTATGGGSSVNCSGTPLSGGTQHCSTSAQGTVGSYGWSIWSTQSGGCITPYGVGAAFKATWNNAGDFLAREGCSWNETKTYNQYGTIAADYAYSKSGSGGGYSYIGVYGWSNNPLIEFYIVDDWFGSAPPTGGGTQVGSFTVDGGTYKIYKHQQVSQPSIHGTQTFWQYFSVRQTARQCGHISVTAHFDQWKSLGLNLGVMYEAKLLVEAGGGSGSIDFTSASMTCS
jgi:endo-1,4-beta-xylanase